MGYVAYNQMYYLGKPFGHIFRDPEVCSTAEEARMKAIKSNTEWNRRFIKAGYQVKLAAVKRVKEKVRVVRKARAITKRKPKGRKPQRKQRIGTNLSMHSHGGGVTSIFWNI